mmetsp:Transcript_18067/g.20830  ORF Transcript_18067/g.20830 Transcript_18067/m.20830 type:complete len:83 (+) Transcript_18067:339-587(+)
MQGKLELNCLEIQSRFVYKSKSKIPASGASVTGATMVEIDSDKFKSESKTDLEIYMASKAFEKAPKTNTDVEAELFFRIDNG